MNDSSLQCARLRTDQSVPTALFNLDRPSKVVILAIVDPPTDGSFSNDITIEFTSPSSSSITEIRLALLVNYSNFTINNQSREIYNASTLPVMHWQNGIFDTYEHVDLISLDYSHRFTDQDLCQWNLGLWNRLFYNNVSTDPPYAYILKTSNPRLVFTLPDTSNRSGMASPPAPYLHVLYCVPYRLDLTELILIIVFGVLFIISVVTVGILHYMKGDEDSRTHRFERSLHRKTHEHLDQHKDSRVRHRSSASASSVAQDDRSSD